MQGCHLGDTLDCRAEQTNVVRVHIVRNRVARKILIRRADDGQPVVNLWVKGIDKCLRHRAICRLLLFDVLVELDQPLFCERALLVRRKTVAFSCNLKEIEGIAAFLLAAVNLHGHKRLLRALSLTQEVNQHRPTSGHDIARIRADAMVQLDAFFVEVCSRFRREHDELAV